MPTAQFSKRLRWGAESNAITRRLAARKPEFDLTESNPTKAGFLYPPALLQALADPCALAYEPDPRGLADVRALVQADLLTASSSESYSYILKLLCDPGDEILVPRPSYPLFEYLADLDCVRVVQYPLFYDQGWHIDTGALRAAVTNRTRAIVIVNPNNPTGSYLKRLELEVLEEIGLPVISDEVFAAYSLSSNQTQNGTGAPGGPGFQEIVRNSRTTGSASRITGLRADRKADPCSLVRTERRSFALTPPEVDRVTCVAAVESSKMLRFSLGGLSKLAGLPQMKLGWIRVGGAERAKAIEGLELIADTYLSVGTPVQWAAKALLESGVREQIHDRVRANLALLPEALHVEGGWYAILRLPAIQTEEEWILHLLDVHGVYVQPGFFFDFESAGRHAVLSLITRPEIFQEGLRRIREATALSHS